MNLYKDIAYSPVLDVIVIKEYGAMTNNYVHVSHLEIPRPNQIIADIQDSYCSAKILLATNGSNIPVYPVTARTTTNPTTMTSVLMTPLPLNMRTTQSSPAQISCVQESRSLFMPRYIKPPRSSLNYNKMKRNLPQSTSHYDISQFI